MLKNYYKPTQSYVICCNSMEKTSQRQLLAMMHLSTPILKQLILNAEKILDQAQNHRRHSEILEKICYPPDPIFIPDNNDLSTTIKDHWTKCGGICLSKRDLQKFTGDKELSDLHINAFQNLLKGQIDSIGRLQSTLLQQKKLSLSNKKEKNLQAINISISPTSKQWAVAKVFLL